MGRSYLHFTGSSNQLFAEDLLCVRHCARCSGYMGEAYKTPCFMELII